MISASGSRRTFDRNDSSCRAGSSCLLWRIGPLGSPFAWPDSISPSDVAIGTSGLTT